MSRIGNAPVTLPSAVTVSVIEGKITVVGPKGALETPLLDHISVSQNDEIISVSRDSDEPKVRAAHGLTRALIQNMVNGVTEGFKKELEVNGVGYRVQVAGTDLKMSLGFSHEIVYKIPADVQVQVEGNKITVTGIDRQRVGQAAADIREFKKPEPYKGKGIKYADERIIRKAGKSGKEK